MSVWSFDWIKVIQLKARYLFGIWFAGALILFSPISLAEKMGITISKLYKTLENARTQHFISIDGFGTDSPALGKLLEANNTAKPDEQLEKKELINQLTEAIGQLDWLGNDCVICFLVYKYMGNFS